jgi:hypothetical protein
MIPFNYPAYLDSRMLRPWRSIETARNGMGGARTESRPPAPSRGKAISNVVLLKSEE